MPIEPWMVDAVAYYRGLGFFTGGGTEEFLLEQLLRLDEARWPGRSHEPLAERWIHRDLGVLELDRERVLALDFEIEASAGQTMYIATIPEIAQITRGVFSAWDIRERRLDDHRCGRIEVSFRVGTDDQSYELCGGGHDWLDAEIFWIIERFLNVSPFRFHAAEQSIPGYQGAVFAALTEDERDAIERDRGLSFLPLPDTPAPPWKWERPTS